MIDDYIICSDFFAFQNVNVFVKKRRLYKTENWTELSGEY